MRHDGIEFLQTHALFGGALNAHQTHAELIFKQFADRPHPAVAEMVNVVNFPFAHPQFQHVVRNGEQILHIQHTLIHRFFQPQFLIDFEAAHLGKIVTIFMEKEVEEQLFRAFFRRRIAGAQGAVNFQQRVKHGAHAIFHEGVAQGVAANRLINQQDFQRIDFGIIQVCQIFLRNLFIALNQHFPSIRVNHVFRRHHAE